VYDLPSYVWALVLAGVFGIPAATCAVLYRGAVAAGVGRRTATAVTAITAAVLGGWLVVSGLLARAGVYRPDPGEVVPWFPVAVAGTLIALLLATRIPLVSRILADPGTSARLAFPHTLRVVGVLFLIVMAQGQLPAAFALPAGLGDIAIGVAAPFVARRLARATGRTGAVRFHVLGILDLIVAGIFGFLLIGLVEVTASTAPLLLLPLVLIPTVPVPLALALHIVSLRRLRTAAWPEEDQTTGYLLSPPPTEQSPCFSTESPREEHLSANPKRNTEQRGR
jgi:hypothetical protein